MSCLTHPVRRDGAATRLHVSFCILSLLLQTSRALDTASIKAEGQLAMESQESIHSRGLIVNWDCTEFFVSRSSEEMTIAGVQALVDQYVGTQVSHIFFNPNGMRTAYASKVRESFWDKNDEVDNALIRNTRLLHQKGIDPYQVWLNRCREKGFSPWISMRMNDVHCVDECGAQRLSKFTRIPASAAWVRLTQATFVLRSYRPSSTSSGQF